jgi:hypothetical protein
LPIQYPNNGHVKPGTTTRRKPGSGSAFSKGMDPVTTFRIKSGYQSRSLDPKYYIQNLGYRMVKQDAQEHCLEPVHLLPDSLGLSVVRLQLEDLE